MSYTIAQVPSAARAGAGQGSGVTVPGNVETISILVNTTAAGTSLALAVQWSNDGTAWAGADPVDTFTAITTTGVVVKTFAVKANQFRLAWTPTGSFTFSADVRWPDRAF